MDPSDCHILVGKWREGRISLRSGALKPLNCCPFHAVDDERISQVVVSSLLRKCNYKGEPGPPSPPTHVPGGGPTTAICGPVSQGSAALPVMRREPMWRK